MWGPCREDIKILVMGNEELLVSLLFEVEQVDVYYYTFDSNILSSFPNSLNVVSCAII